MNIEWKDCEPNMENFLTNVKRLDPLYNLTIMTSVLYSYYSINNNDKTPKDLENVLRSDSSIEVGLVAVNWKKDPHYAKLINSGLGAIIKRKYLDKVKGEKYAKLEDIPKEYLADYITFTSCRPREDVIKETLTHSESLEENLEKLENAGDYVHFELDNLDESLAEGDIKLNDAEIEMSKKIMNGEKLAVLTKADLEKEFMKDLNNNPGAQIVACGTLSDKTPISGLVKDGKLVSNIGMNIFMHNGQQMVEYMYLPALYR